MMLRAAGRSFTANDSIADVLKPGEAEALMKEVRSAFDGVLSALVIDTESDHNTIGTSERMARMYVRELFKGRYEAPPRVVSFPNGKKLDELYCVGPVTVRSTCSHHLCPVIGEAWYGVIPSKNLIGISKFARLTEWIMSRPQIQEEAVVQLADAIEARIDPKGLGVVIRASHSCMTWRGVREHGTMMTTNVMRGILREAPAARAEFLQFVNGKSR